MTDQSTKEKPKVGFYTFTCCEGCQFAMLFVDNILELLDQFEIPHFNLLKEKNVEAELDLAFVEGAITTTTEIEELESIRQRSRTIVAMGTCACNGGIPAMKNFVDSKALHKYVYHHKKHPNPVPPAGVGEHVEVDYYLRGCPVIKDELVQFLQMFRQGAIPEPYEGVVCSQCPRRTTNCFMKQKTECLGSLTKGGCGALCTSKGIPCMLCRGPTEGAKIERAIKLFEKFGLQERDIHDRLNLFMNVEGR